MLISTPAALALALKTCIAAGCSLTLQGTFPSLTISANTAPITIDATAATITYTQLISATSVSIFGGTFGPATYASINIENSTAISIQRGTFPSPVTAGISASNSTALTLAANTITNSSGDGIDIAGGSNVSITNTSCFNFHALAGRHPDCVAGWSIGVDRRLTNVSVDYTVAEGDTQGVTFFDHPILAPNQPGTGGFDNITIRHSQLAVSQPQCVALYNASNSTVTDNTCYTLKGAQWAARVNLINDTNLTQSNNINGLAP